MYLLTQSVLAVPEDVRDRGEQHIGEEVTYWNTHSGQIGTGGGGATYPYYARAKRAQMLLVPQAQMQMLRHFSADDANAQVISVEGKVLFYGAYWNLAIACDE